MRTFIIIVAAAALLALGAGPALAAPSSQPKTVTVVMHDPGCHWFSVGGKLLTKLTVTGSVSLLNVDEATLRVSGPRGVKFDKVGKQTLLTRGVYRITMVKQAPDDNHLVLVVK